MDTSPFRVLVPLDGTVEAETALRWIPLLAPEQNLRVTLLQAIEHRLSDVPARSYLAQVVRFLEVEGIDAELITPWGDPRREILHQARPGRFDAIAMATHGRRGMRRMVEGSVAEEVLRRAEIPLLISRPGMDPGDGRRFVVALDGSAFAERILEHAVRLARQTAASLHLVRVMAPPLGMGTGAVAPECVDYEEPLPYLRAVCGKLEHEGAAATPVARQGWPAEEITRYAREAGASLILLTTHGRSGIGRVILGSVAEEVLRTAPCPVYLRRAVLAEAPPAASGLWLAGTPPGPLRVTETFSRSLSPGASGNTEAP